MIAALASSAPAFAGPAADEYKLRFPNAKGKQNANSESPTADPSSLSGSVAAGLSKSKNGKALATIATAEELGAPDLANADTGGDTSLLGALVDALTDPVVIAILLALAGIGGGIAVLRNRRDSPGP